MPSVLACTGSGRACTEPCARHGHRSNLRRWKVFSYADIQDLKTQVIDVKLVITGFANTAPALGKSRALAVGGCYRETL